MFADTEKTLYAKKCKFLTEYHKSALGENILSYVHLEWK